MSWGFGLNPFAQNYLKKRKKSYKHFTYLVNDGISCKMLNKHHNLCDPRFVKDDPVFPVLKDKIKEAWKLLSDHLDNSKNVYHGCHLFMSFHSFRNLPKQKKTIRSQPMSGTMSCQYRVYSIC